MADRRWKIGGSYYLKIRIKPALLLIRNEGAGLAGAVIGKGFLGQAVEATGLDIGIDLAVPGVVEIDFAKPGEELVLFPFTQLADGVEDFGHAHEVIFGGKRGVSIGGSRLERGRRKGWGLREAIKWLERRGLKIRVAKAGMQSNLKRREKNRPLDPADGVDPGRDGAGTGAD